jgi:hypothetical protein
MGCCHPIATFRAAFNPIEDVKWVPGLRPGDKPRFVDRVKFWRGCCLLVSSCLGFLYVILSMVNLSLTGSRIKDTLNLFPRQIRPHFAWFVYAEFTGSVLSELAGFLAVAYVIIAFATREHFKESSARARRGWFLFVIGPAIPFLIFPYGATFRADLAQRDTCACVLSVMLRDPFAKTVFAQAANSAGVPELAMVAMQVQTPLMPGDPGYESTPIPGWCESRKKDWAQVIFGQSWVQSESSVGVSSMRLALPTSHTSYPGVVPQLLSAMMLAVGIPPDPAFTFCDKQDLLTSGDLSKIASAPQRSLLEARSALHLHVATNKTTKVSNAHATEFSISSTGGIATSANIESHHQSPGLRVKNPLATSLDARPAQTAFIQLDEETQMENPLGPAASAMGKSAICSVRLGVIALLKVATLSGVLMQQVLGVICAAKCVAALFVTAICIVDGLIKGAKNVKTVLRRSSLPGYLLTMAVFATLPPLLLVLCTLGQALASPMASIGVTALAVYRILDLWTAEIMVNVSKRKKLEEKMNAIAWFQRFAKLVTGLAFLGYGIYMFITMRVSAQINIDLLWRKLESALAQPLFLVATVVKGCVLQVITFMVTSEFLIQAILDAADDDLKVKGEDEDEIVESWQKFTGTKKKKKDEADEQKANAEQAAEAQAAHV